MGWRGYRCFNIKIYQLDIVLPRSMLKSLPVDIVTAFWSNVVPMCVSAPILPLFIAEDSKIHQARRGEDSGSFIRLMMDGGSENCECSHIVRW
jgi:hypothetical protein